MDNHLQNQHQFSIATNNDEDKIMLENLYENTHKYCHTLSSSKLYVFSFCIPRQFYCQSSKNATCNKSNSITHFHPCPNLPSTQWPFCYKADRRDRDRNILYGLLETDYGALTLLAPLYRDMGTQHRTRDFLLLAIYEYNKQLNQERKTTFHWWLPPVPI